jgi:hypothetical protein
MIRLINDDVMFVDEHKSTLRNCGSTVVEHLRGEIYTRADIEHLFGMVGELIRLRKNLVERGRDARGVIMIREPPCMFMKDDDVFKDSTVDYKYVTVKDIDELLEAIPVLARCL